MTLHEAEICAQLDGNEISSIFLGENGTCHYCSKIKPEEFFYVQSGLSSRYFIIGICYQCKDMYPDKLRVSNFTIL